MATPEELEAEFKKQEELQREFARQTSATKAPSPQAPEEDESFLSAASGKAAEFVKEHPGLAAYGRGAVNFASGSFGDEASGVWRGLATALNVDDSRGVGEGLASAFQRGYRSGRGEERREDKKARKEHAVEYGLGQASVALPLAVGGGLLGAAQGISRGGLAAAGILEGAAQGLGASEGGVKQQLIGTGLGAGVGGATAAFPVAAGVPALGYGVATGETADVIPLLAGAAGGAAAKVAGGRLAQRKNAVSERKAAIKEAQETAQKKIAELDAQQASAQEIHDADIEAAQNKVVREAGEEAKAAYDEELAGIQKDEKAAKVAAEEEAAAGRKAEEAQAAAEVKNAETLGEQSAIREVAKMAQAYNEAKNAYDRYNADEARLQSLYKDYRSMLMKAKPGDPEAQEKARIAGIDLMAASEKLGRDRARLDAKVLGKLGQATQSDYEALHHILQDPNWREGLSPEQVARGESLIAQFNEYKARRLDQPSAKQLADDFRAELEAEHAAREATIEKKRKALEESAAKQSGGRAAFTKKLYNRGKELGLDVGPRETFDPDKLPTLPGERPDLPVPISAEQKRAVELMKIKKYLDALAAERAGRGAKPPPPTEGEGTVAGPGRKRDRPVEAPKAEEPKAAEAPPEGTEDTPFGARRRLAKNLLGEHEVEKRREEKLGILEAETLKPKRVRHEEALKEMIREQEALRSEVSPEAIVKKGERELAAGPEKSPGIGVGDVVGGGKVKALFNVGAKLFNRGKETFKSPHARAAFHNNVLKKLEESARAKIIDDEQFSRAGNLLQSFTNGAASTAELALAAERFPWFADAVNSVLEEEDNAR